MLYSDSVGQPPRLTSSACQRVNPILQTDAFGPLCPTGCTAGRLGFVFAVRPPPIAEALVAVVSVPMPYTEAIWLQAALH